MSEEPVDFLIVGGGVAGYSAARALRENGAEGSIALVTRDLDPPYDRTMCTKGYLQGRKTREETLLAATDWYAGNDIALSTRTSVLKLDAGSRTATLSDKRTLRFGKALLATGANVRRLRVDGSDLHGIHYVRALANSDAIRADAQDAEDVVMIGGSYIATEVAASLTALGRRCTLVMQEGITLERGFGPRAGAFFQRVLEEHGVMICGSDELERFEGSDGRVTHVVTAQGRRIPAQVVVIGAGVVPDAMLAQKAGLEIGATGGVMASSALQTSSPDVFVAGDMAEYESVVHRGARLRIEHWDVAEQQGRTAADGMMGRPRPHDAIPYFFSDLADWASMEYVGPARQWDEEVVRGSIEDGAFTIIYLDAGCVVAGLSVGRGQDLDGVRALMRSHANVHDRRAELADLGTDLASIASAAPGAGTGDSPAVVTVSSGGAGGAEGAAEPQPADAGATGDGAGQLYMCQMCGFIYDPEEGDEVGEIPAGTRFADLPDEWTCPVCGSQKTDFEPMDE